MRNRRKRRKFSERENPWSIHSSLSCTTTSEQQMTYALYQTANHESLDECDLLIPSKEQSKLPDRMQGHYRSTISNKLLPNNVQSVGKVFTLFTTIIATIICLNLQFTHCYQRIGSNLNRFQSTLQLTTSPPQYISKAPVVAVTSQDFISQQGGIINNRTFTFTKQNNPILITKDIIINKNSKLTIEAGTEILFDKRKGIIVHGTLEILGLQNDKVKLNLLKSQRTATVNLRSQNNNPISQQTVRLVDGDLPSEGRVQIKFNDKWHSLCTNSKNLTSADIKVICQQVGYQDGYWYKWFPKRNETLHQLMSKSFHCVGSESSITQCQRWNRIRAGGGICDNHSDIGIRCTKTLVFGSPYAQTPYDYWRGIEFVNSESSQETFLDGQMNHRVSRSILQHVAINEAGMNEVGNATGAIRVYGQPPKMDDVEIKNSIYGIMIEDVDDAVRMKNIKLVNNMAFPLFINTSWGKVALDNMHVENNGGDGIRIARHERVYVGKNDFCKFANLRTDQTYPVVLHHEQKMFTTDSVCCQEFISDNQLTVHFPVLRSTLNNLLPESDPNRKISVPPGVNLGRDAYLLIHDDYREDFAFKLKIQNNTRAQSIVSKSGRLKICYEPAIYRTVLFTIEVVANQDDDWSGVANDVEISNSFISGNEGRGIWVENPRSGIFIQNTTVLNHNYLSGIHVENGTGQVIIQGGEISNNTGHGLFINLAGGYYHIDNSTISHNSQKGIMIEYDKRPELVSFNHTMHMGYSLVTKNGENGLFIGNVCRSDAFWNVSMNSFIRNGEDAIYFQSCLPTPEITLGFKNFSTRLNLSDPELIFHNNYQEFLITHNVFLANSRRAIHMAPVFFLKSFIRHNLFREQQLAVIYINNQNLLNMDVSMDNSIEAPVNIRIASNRFYKNFGRYVANIGAQEDNPKHAIVFTKNTLEENSINEPYTDLKPRSRVSAVVVVSSSNTKVIRNRFNNPESQYELGCHLERHHKIINATTNFWGYNLDAMSVYRRIFDRKNRYNLAQVEFLQYLLSPEDLEYATDLSFDRERDKISTFRNGTRLGGEVKGYEDLPTNTYIVQDDIFIRSAGHLIIRPGTVLKFNDGVGMMVQGRLDAVGHANSQILFTSSIAASRSPQRVPITTTPAPQAIPWVSYQSDGDNSSLINNHWRVLSKRQTSFSNSISPNVRLSHTTMGRLEVQIDGVWGSVCGYNFDIDDAAVVCQQMGMILNKDDWLLERFQYAADDQQQMTMMTTNVLMTNLRCDPSLDTDVTKCKAEISSRGDFDGLCDSEVGIRCFPPSWSGVRLGMGAETSYLEHLTIQRAGMFDYVAYDLKPALQIDFNRHVISSIVVKSNSDSGLGIIWNDVIGRHFSELTIVDSKFLNNERHGIELRSKGLTIKSSSISNNRQNGLDYNPTFSQKELIDLTSWLYTTRNLNNIVHLTFPIGSSSRHFSVPSSEDSYRFYIFQRNPTPNLTETFTIGTDYGHMLSLHLLHPIHPESTETLNMSIGTNPEALVWDFKTNMTSFPMVSPGYKFHFNYSTGKKPIGNIVLYIRTRYNSRDLKLLNRYIPPHLIMNKFELTAMNINSKLINSLTITNTNITKNGIGLKFRNPNNFFGPLASYNLRYCNETTNITNNLFDGNHFSSIFVGSDDYELFNPEASNNKTVPASEIIYNVLSNKMRRNKDGIRQFSRDVRQSHNVYHWSINDTLFEQNRGGGINIVLPYYWRYDANLSHTIVIHNNSFLKNSQFEVALNGHYAVMNITKNNLRENRCRNGLLEIGGMEKKISMRFNTIESNACNRLVEFNIHSHADKMGFVQGHFEYNSLRSNRRLNSSYASLILNHRNSRLLQKLHPQANDFALSLRGIQSLNISRNIFLNPDLRFELVVAIIMEPTERTVNAMENYWGSLSYNGINDRIFDFDDWNSYAVAELSPFLLQDSFTSATSILETRDLLPQLDRFLGGRLTKSMTLPYRKEPYIVESDLTVMPNVRLVIEKGVILEFMPSVGILVLGDLIAAGTREKPIQMRPALSSSDIMPLYFYLFPSKTKPNFYQPNYNDQATYDQNHILKHLQLAYPIDLGSLRLCKNEICNDGKHIYENNVEDKNLRQEVLKTANNTWRMDGFLELFNMTTLQWVPVCDPLFNEYTAKVVCKQLGYSHLSLFRRGRRWTFEQEQIISIKHWPESIQCAGDETTLSSCPLAPTGFNNHTAACTRESNQFVYVHCQDFPEVGTTSLTTHGATNDNVHHWGGIRFSCPSSMISSSENPQQDIRDSYNMINQSIAPMKSRLQYVSVDRAGILHRKKAPAIQVLQCNIPIEYTAITNSAHHGLEIVASQGNQNFHQLRIRNNSGVGLNYLPLAGSSSASKLVPYLPLKHLDISSDIFGLVDICGANKELQIEERMLLFYRYSSQPADCVKIISSKLQIKHIGIRMLQFDLFNSTLFNPRPDYLRIYDGDIFNRDSRLIVELGTAEKHKIERPELKFYQTTDSTMTVRMHASGASYLYGFIAEVVTTPVSYNIQRDTFNNITSCEITNNKLGAVTVSSAGESSPNLIFKNNRFEGNCLHLFGNFTSCISSIHMELQNCQKLRVTNNLFKSNQGGLTIKSYSHTAVSALEAYIENNVFESNQNTNALTLLGPRTDPYQTVRVNRNIFTRNVAQYFSNIVLSRIVANFSNNLITGNIGKHQIEVIGFDKLPLSYQTFANNWIYNNSATFERDKSTVFGNSAGQQYFNNYLVNPDNHFEISTMNWSRYDVKPFGVLKYDDVIHLASGDGSTKDVFRKTADSIPVNIVETKKLDLYNAAINAKQNWWGFDTSPAIHNRIRDRNQHEELLKVDFIPYLETNRSLLSGICAGGWRKVGNSCLVYIGTKMTYQEAKDFCERERAALPLLKGDHYEISDFIQSQDKDFDSKIDRIWVRSFEVSKDDCPSLNDYRTRNFNCNDKNPFLCEKDPLVVVSLLHWHRETTGLVALILALITIILMFCCSICWFYKAKQRHKENVLRKNKLYASIRSNRGPYSSSNSLSESSLHRQIYNTDKSSITDLSSLTQPTNDSSNLVRLDPNYSSARDLSRSRSSLITSPSYDSSRAKPALFIQEPQPSMNPAYVSPSPQSYNSRSQHEDLERQQLKLKSRYEQKREDDEKKQQKFQFREQPNLQSQQPQGRETKQKRNIATPSPLEGISNSNGSLTASYSGSQINDIFIQPMPNLAPVFSQINHALNSSNNMGYHTNSFKPMYNGPLNYTISAPRQPQQLQQQPQTLSPQTTETSDNSTSMRNIDESLSSNPTHYSNQIEAYNNLDNQNLMDTVTYSNDNAFNNALQKLSNDQVSYVLTEKTSIIDQITKTSTIDSQTDIISMNPQGSTNDFMFMNNYYNPSNTKAYSESGGSLYNRYCVETSFDFEDGNNITSAQQDQDKPVSNTETKTPASLFGSSQRLSPVSFSFGQLDSKQGSRVYLETSFE